MSSTFRFWTNWVAEANGLSLEYTLGDDFGDYLRQPVLGGVPTFAVAAVHVLMIGCGTAIGWFAARRAWLAGWRRALAELSGKGSATAFTLAAGMGGFGLVFTLTGLPVHRHYMNLTFPLMYLWLALLALGPSDSSCPTSSGESTSRLRRGRALLVAMCLLQFAVSAAFLVYVHENQRPIRGDYGTPYRAQGGGVMPR